MLGLTPGRPPKFVKQYADLRSVMTDAVRTWAEEVVAGEYPGPEHQYR
jgi:3-methyl-2-oxobutanoate hydroxymethyltransferase